jgi:hypothetical protein
MVGKRLVLGAGLWAVWLLAGCGESANVPTRQDRILGGVKEGAPLGRGVADPGILADPTTYQPARVTGVGQGSGPGRRLAQAAAKADEPAPEADAEVKTTVRDLVNALTDDDPQLALRFFDPEQVRPLLDKENVGTLLNTYEKVDLLRQHLERKLAPDEARVEQLLAPFQGAAGELKWDVLDANHVSISPNLTAPLFGPKAAPTLQLARQDDDWRFQLDAPLTDDDVSAIVAFHEQLQESLDRIVEWVATTETVDTDQLAALLATALQGEVVEPGAAQPAAGPKGKGGGEKTTPGKARPMGGKGQRRPPSGP